MSPEPKNIDIRQTLVLFFIFWRGRYGFQCRFHRLGARGHRSLFSGNPGWEHDVFSGQLGIDPATGKLAEGGVKAQAQQSLKNIAALLAAIDATPADIVKTTIYLVDMADFAAVNEVYGGFFDGAFPARSCVAVHQLPMGGLECVCKPFIEAK